MNEVEGKHHDEHRESTSPVERGYPLPHRTHRWFIYFLLLFSFSCCNFGTPQPSCASHKEPQEPKLIYPFVLLELPFASRFLVSLSHSPPGFIALLVSVALNAEAFLTSLAKAHRPAAASIRVLKPLACLCCSASSPSTISLF